MLTTLDYVVIVIYLTGVAFFGARLAGRQASIEDYFLGNRDLPWWVVCMSTVATETSALTVIGLPAVAYGGALTFLQLTLGYLLGRTIVSFVLLPRYHERKLATTYEFLGDRYGDTIRAVASFTFLVTRLLADGVRLFASAIPLKIIAMSAGFDVSYLEIVLVLATITVFYTLIGGIRAVVWMDVVQLFVYVGGGVLTLVILLASVPADWWAAAAAEGKTLFIDPGTGLADWLTRPYVLPTAVLGGAVFSIASHGTDQLIVQRLLACRSLRDSQKALIGSTVIVMFEFALFLTIGLLLWRYYDGMPIADLGMSRADEILPRFIAEGLPAGVAGLMLAGITAAAMSTISSTVNSLASSSLFDILRRLTRSVPDERRSVKASRLLTVFWGIVLVGFASLFEDTENAVVELGLTIASYTYGATLGVFFLGIVNRRTDQTDALIAFFVTVLAMILIIFGVWHGTDGWVLVWRPTASEIAVHALTPLAWPWYPVIGAAITLLVGTSASLVRPSARYLRST